MYSDSNSRQFGGPLEDDAEHIWRYMSLAALLQMLQSRTLFFPSIGELAATDPWEGRWYGGEEPVVRHAVKESVRRQLEKRPETEEDRKHYETADFTSNIQKALGKWTYISCWHSNSGESAAMWTIYGANSGIAVQSRVGLLKSAFAVEERPVAICRVDYDSSLGPKDPPIRLALRKRSSFSHEREIRAVVVDTSNEIGLKVKLDLDALVEKIYIWPLALPWMLDVVKAEVRLHGLDKSVAKSSLYDPV